MSGGWWIALITTGCFCALASFSTGKYHPDARPERSTLSAFMAEKLNTYVPSTAEVKLWKAGNEVERIVAQANGHMHGLEDKVKIMGNQKRERCGDDYVCLFAWFEQGKRK